MWAVGVIVTLPLWIGLMSARFWRSSRSSFIFIWASTRCCNDAAKPFLNDNWANEYICGEISKFKWTKDGTWYTYLPMVRHCFDEILLADFSCVPFAFAAVDSDASPISIHWNTIPSLISYRPAVMAYILLAAQFDVLSAMWTSDLMTVNTMLSQSNVVKSFVLLMALYGPTTVGTMDVGSFVCDCARHVLM